MTATSGCRIAEVESWVAGSLHIVRVRDERGNEGIGQSACWAYPEATHAVVSRFRDALIGLPSDDIPRTWTLLFRMGPFRGSILSGAVSAIDIALWDLKGKQLSAPVFELLGGRARDRIRLHLLILGWRSLEELVGLANDAVVDGFTALKFDPLPVGYQDMAEAEIVEHVSANARGVREAVGEKVDLIFELHRSFDSMRGANVARALQRHSPLFVEDPIQIDSIQDQGSLAARLDGPLGQGERIHSIWEARELLQSGGPQFLRTDVGLAGGISHAVKIAAVAEAFGGSLSFHTFSGPVVSAAAAHVGLAVQNLATQEWFPRVDEPGRLPAFRSSLAREGGWLLPPSVPGLGVEFDEAGMEKFELQDQPVGDVLRRRDGSIALAP